MANKEVSTAAEKVAAAEKKKDKKPAIPNGNWLARAGKAIKKFFKDIKGEIKKIEWPDTKTVCKSTLVVLAAVAICGVAIFAVDQLLAFVISLLEKAAGAVASSVEAGEAVEETAEAGIIALRNFFIVSSMAGTVVVMRALSPTRGAFSRIAASATVSGGTSLPRSITVKP